MNKIINQILTESKLKKTEGQMYDDSFFQPKNIKKRDEEIKDMREIFVTKIKLGLQNIKREHKNKDFKSIQEESFLQIFSTLCLDKNYDKKPNGYFLENERTIKRCFFDLSHHTLALSYPIWIDHFDDLFSSNIEKFRYFIEKMLEKYFKLDGIKAYISPWKALN